MVIRPREPFVDPAVCEDIIEGELAHLPFLISRLECGQIEDDDIDAMIDIWLHVKKIRQRIDTTMDTLKKRMTSWLEARKFDYYTREKDDTRVTRLIVEENHFDAGSLKLYLSQSDYDSLRRTVKKKRLLVQTKKDRIKASRVQKHV